ncbi:hypothetical protein MKK65_02540 [Methylobacterium sp. J-001]|uniref:hypothetical protein n=1 Tax=Methylobacterium sp. J-001 TaxID=2836609 RepID=UPI001FBA9A6D|nr:hypothetical protein [Methylobacterium sp. J-001]MCJ2115485.1 hypothetical protein [Methylobacterium sp. J-001]
MEAFVEDGDREFEHSPLSGSFTRDGETVDVEIYRFAGTQDPWQLAVVHMSSGSTEWLTLFATEQEAYRAFADAVERDDIASFGATATARKMQ